MDRSNKIDGLTGRLPFSTEPKLPTLLFSIVFATVFGLYLLTLAPGVVGGDAGEHQFAIPLLGIPHTTGYPLYILTGKLWTLLIPAGSMAWRMNLFSAFGGALAAGTTTLAVYHLVRKARWPDNGGNICQERWAGPIVAGISLSFGLTLWQWSIIAGVRSFNVFFFALLTLQAVIWAHQRQSDEAQKAERTLLWLAFTVGLSLAHHRTTIFYLPSLIIWIWWYDRRLLRQPGRIVTLVLLSLAPLSLYLFILIRGISGPPYTHEPIYNLQSFWFLVGSSNSNGLFFSIDPAFLPARLAFMWADVMKQLSVPGVILAAIGGIALLRQYPAHFLCQGLLVLLLSLFTLDFEVVNLNEAPTWYLMPAYFIFAVWVGVGVNAILDFGYSVLDLLKRRRPAAKPMGWLNAQLFITMITLAVLTYALGWQNWQTQYSDAVLPLDDWRQHLRGTQAQRFVESSLPYVEPNSIIWSDWEQYTPLNYYQYIHGLRRDVSVHNPLNRWPERVVEAQAAGQSIYFARKPTDLIGTPYLSMVGPLIHIGTAPRFDPPSDIILLNANFEDELELIGYKAEVWPQYATSGSKIGLVIPAAKIITGQEEPILQVTLYWRTVKKVKWDYALSLRLLDNNGHEIYKRDATHPVLSSYPTSLWTPGEVVSDFYELTLPAQSAPLTLQVLPYRTEAPGQWYNLRLNDAQPGQDGIVFGPFELVRR